MVHLRRCQKQDLAGLYELDQVCFPPGIAYSRADLEYFFSHPRSSCWIAEKPDGNVAGFLILQRNRRSGLVVGHIVTLDVHPAARRNGLGTLLMQAAEKQMKEEGAGVMSLEVAENNIAARQFYLGLGFETRGRIAKYYGGKVDAEVMEKLI